MVRNGGDPAGGIDARPPWRVSSRVLVSAVERIETETSVEIVEREGAAPDVLAGVEERPELTPYPYRAPWMRPFLSVLARTGDVSSAARAVGKNRTYLYEARRRDAMFAAGWAEAQDVASDLLDQVAWRRATVGEEVVVTRTTRRFKQEDGRQVLVEENVVEERSQRRSDAVLMLLMRARRPHVYGDRVDHRVGGADGGPVKLEVYRAVTRERAEELAALWAEEQGFVHPDVDGSASVSVNGDAAA